MSRMSRDARKILDNLSKLTGRSYAATDLFIAEGLVTGYFVANVNSIIKQIFKRSKSEERFGLQYYIQPVLSMAKQKRQDGSVWEMTDDEKRIYWFVTHSYLMEDFNFEQLLTLRQLCQYRFEDVSAAIAIGRQEDVFSIPYIYRIVEGTQVKREYQTHKIQKRRELVIDSQPDQVISRGVAEIASLSYSWQQTIENLNLQEKVDKLYREGNNGRN